MYLYITNVLDAVSGRRTPAFTISEYNLNIHDWFLVKEIDLDVDLKDPKLLSLATVLLDEMEAKTKVKMGDELKEIEGIRELI